MKPAMTFSERRVIVAAREALAMCDYSRARRTDPTPEQTERARARWRESVLTQWLVLMKSA